MPNITNPYVGYSYAYPHKTAYRKLANPYLLQNVWKDENINNLFLYFHIPFCSGRCCFCNLFSLAKPHAELISNYINAIKRQCDLWSNLFPKARYSRMAIGGGTPSVLSIEQMDQLFSIISSMGCNLKYTYSSVEVSPETTTKEILHLLQLNNVQRISLGVQTFDKNEMNILGRRGSLLSVENTLSDIHDIGFSTVNIDLIYGIESQTEESWINSLKLTIQYMPEQIYMYPLYVQKYTQLSGRYKPDNDHRIHLYQIGKDYLLAAGYKQHSMRMFSKYSSDSKSMPVYCCQEDGMVGFGVGARSYTRQFHYSSEYAVLPKETSRIINDYTSKQDWSIIDYGIELNVEEQKRRYIIKSILQCDGLNKNDYRILFNSDPMDEYNILRQYEEYGLLVNDSSRIFLTSDGIKLSDYIGPSLYSDEIRTRMYTYQWK